MKSTLVRPKEADPTQISYPCLMDGGEGLVVLFTKLSTGTVVSQNALWPLGAIHSNWHSPSFTPYKGTVVLSNDD